MSGPELQCAVAFGRTCNNSQTVSSHKHDLFTHTACTNTHSHRIPPLPPKAVSVLASPPHGLCCFCGHLTIELKIIYRAFTSEHPTEIFRVEKETMEISKEKELCDAGKCPLTSVFEEKEKNALLVSEKYNVEWWKKMSLDL